MSHDLKKKTVFDVDGFILLSDDKILRGWKRAQKKVESLQNVREKIVLFTLRILSQGWNFVCQ